MKQVHDDLQSAYNLALRRLGSSAMTRKQTQLYLGKKGYTQNIVCQVINRLSADGYIDDVSFAANLVMNTLERDPKSRTMLANELRLKGVDDEALSHAIQLIDDERQQEMAVRLAHKYLRKHKLDDSENIKSKVSRMLYRQGFEYSVIIKTIKSIIISDDLDSFEGGH